MKKINIYIASLLLSALAVSCSVDDLKPQGTLDEDTAFSSPEKLVTAAYAKLGDDWYSYPFNLWPYGDMSADDCLKGGSGENDTGYHPMEIFSTLQPDRGEFDELWYQLYSAISRCNRALEAMQNVEETANIKQLKAADRIYGYGKYSTMPKDDLCHLFIYNREGEIVTVLFKTRQNTYNLKTREKDAISTYKNCGAIWFTLNGR